MQHLSKEEFTNLMSSRAGGKTTLNIPKKIARHFFTRVGSDHVEDTTGISVTFKKLVILLGILMSPTTFGLFAISIYTGFGTTYASIVVPLAGICWTIVYGLTSDRGGWLVGTIPLALAVALYLGNLSLGLPVLLFVASIWLQRATYLLAGIWLEKIISDSYDAFEMLVDHITISSAD